MVEENFNIFAKRRKEDFLKRLLSNIYKFKYGEQISSSEQRRVLIWTQTLKIKTGPVGKRTEKWKYKESTQSVNYFMLPGVMWTVEDMIEFLQRKKQYYRK